MEFFEVTLGDIGILIVIGIAGMMGLALGMVKAVLFVTSWIGAGLITLYTYESVTPLFAKMFGQQLYAEVAGASSIFIISVIVLIWICSRFWIAVRRSEFNGLDRSLGLLGGVFVGAFLTCVAYLGAIWIWSEDELPISISDAYLRPYVQTGTNVIRGFLPNKAQKSAKTAVGDTQRRIRDAMKTDRTIRRLLDNSSKGSVDPSPEQKGYATPSRRDMDRLFESKR